MAAFYYRKPIEKTDGFVKTSTSFAIEVFEEVNLTSSENSTKVTSKLVTLDLDNVNVGITEGVYILPKENKFNKFNKGKNNVKF